MELLPLGDGPDANRRLGDDAQATFRSHQEMTQIRTGCAGGERWKIPWPIDGLDMPSRELVFNSPVVERLLAAGAGGDPAAKRGQFERLREVTEGIAMLLELSFQVGATNSRP